MRTAFPLNFLCGNAVPMSSRPTTLNNTTGWLFRGVCRISQWGGPNYKIFVNFDIHAAKCHVASSEAASRC